MISEKTASNDQASVKQTKDRSNSPSFLGLPRQTLDLAALVGEGVDLGKVRTRGFDPESSKAIVASMRKELQSKS